MNALDAVRTGWEGLSGHKLRSSLTMLGIVIGVAAVISLMSVGKGAQALVVQNVESLGSNLIFVLPGASTESGVRQAAGSALTLTLEDAEAIAENVPGVLAVAPTLTQRQQVVAGDQNMNVGINGVTPAYMQVRNLSLGTGEFINDRQQAGRARVVVLGANVASTLFGDLDPVGQSVRLGRNRMDVIGILQSKGGTFFGSEDDSVFVPLSTLQRFMVATRTARGERALGAIIVQVNDRQRMEGVSADIAGLLRERHRLGASDDFQVVSQEDIIATVAQVTGVLTLLLGSIAAISLLVGGIGVMNIMLVSVTERTREIGIRKAVGARRRDVLFQFLVESVFLSIGGGAIGIAMGWAGAAGISRISAAGQTFQTLVTPDIVALAFLVAAAVGLFFGIYPAFRAARLNPIEALRYE